ncbi:MAG: endonuclease/exonuclease/phosphatase family protein [Elainellaceae cyanobacterium]
MTTKLRIGTFNLENLDDRPTDKPSLEERIAVMRPQLLRMNADILCLQEVHGQEELGKPRRLSALTTLLKGTPYADYHRVSTMTQQGLQVYDKRNLVILSRFEVLSHDQYFHEFANAPSYRSVTAIPESGDAIKAKSIKWERPIFHARIQLPGDRILDVINLHLKSKIPTSIAGQQLNAYTWKSASGWAEGFFISSMKRVGQALETRILIDHLFDDDEQALIAVCGDFNANSDEVPVEAICGRVENTGNGALARRVLVPCEQTIPESSRYTLFHHGQGTMIDHLLISRSLLAYYRGAEIHNELLPDESIAFASDVKFPESDHAPVIAEFEFPDES